MALERAPQVAQRIAADGHEVCAHGHRWAFQLGMDEARERLENDRLAYVPIDVLSPELATLLDRLEYLARDAHGLNPGRGYVRMALVPDLPECVEAAARIVGFCR